MVLCRIHRVEHVPGLSQRAGLDIAFASARSLEIRTEGFGLLRYGTGTLGLLQLLDVGSGLRPPGQVDTLLVAELKTAAYTCTVPLQAGAVLARAP